MINVIMGWHVISRSYPDTKLSNVDNVCCVEVGMELQLLFKPVCDEPWKTQWFMGTF